MERRVLISGCSGGGKSTLVAELSRRGFRTIEEPGRRVVVSERASGGRALPWIDQTAFARRALALAIRDHRAVAHLAGWTLFDRSVIDAAVALRHATGTARLDPAVDRHRYHRLAFLAPPWPELFAPDTERRDDIDAAVAEFDRLSAALPTLGHVVFTLPRISVGARADLVADLLGRYPV